MNILFRPIAERDLADYIHFAKEANFGFTTLPRDPKLVEKKLACSLASFEKHVETPGDEFYLFVAEDLDNHTVLGISAITATTGGTEPLYFYKKESYSVSSSIPDIVKTVPILSSVSYVRSTTEMCSLFVLPQYQMHGIGKLLSFGRFLFMKAYMQRFTGTIFAELRGVVDNNFCSIFWKGVGQHFFNKPLYEVYDMLQYGKSFVTQLLPKYPIYIELLPKEVQDTIGKNDPGTQGALHLLQEIGFQITNELDVFDAGPKLTCPKESITIINETCVLPVIDIKDSVGGQSYFIGNMRLDFRCIVTECACDEGIILSRKAAQMLEVGLGDNVLVYERISKR